MRHLAGAIALAVLLAWSAGDAGAQRAAYEREANDRSRGASGGAPQGAAAREKADVPDFAREIKPLLVRHCYRCHGADQQQSGYRLDQKETAFRGGDTGERAIVAGDADNSPLVQYIRGDDPDFVMPPEGERLTEAEVKRVVRWVQGGAPWPEP